jgi:hypothetical protein
MPISSRSILILSSHLRLGLPKGILPVGLPVKIFKHSYLPPFWLHVLPYFNLLVLITLTILSEWYILPPLYLLI